jgi:hypothetical protein
VAFAERSGGSVALLSPPPLGALGVGLAALILALGLFVGGGAPGAVRGQEALVS